jgi:iron-sulfur cluster assembly accessory protein
MSVQTFSVNDAVTVTPAAAEHFSKTLSRKGGAGVRISLKKSGCTGFKYVIEEIAAAQADDLQLTLANGVKVFIAPTDVSALRGAEIDYTTEGLNSTLKINNPNVKEACGCGESFSI